MREVLSASGVLDPVGWIDWVEPGEWLDGVAWGVKILLCGRVSTGVGWWFLFSLQGDFYVREGPPRAGDRLHVLEARYCEG